MTREQQEEIISIIHGKGGWLEGFPDHGGDVKTVKGCDTLYTHEIKRILNLGADIFYTEKEMRITNWIPDPPPKPELQNRMEITPFIGHDKMELRQVKDCSMNHSHIELWCNGLLLGYMHIQHNRIHWCPRIANVDPQ